MIHVFGFVQPLLLWKSLKNPEWSFSYRFFENGLLAFNISFIIVRALIPSILSWLKDFYCLTLCLYVNSTLAIFCYCWLLIWQSILYPVLGHVMMKHTWRGQGWSTWGHDCAVPLKLVLQKMRKTKPYPLPLETVFCEIREKLVHFPAFWSWKDSCTKHGTLSYAENISTFHDFSTEKSPHKRALNNINLSLNIYIYI